MGLVSQFLQNVMAMADHKRKHSRKRDHDEAVAPGPNPEPLLLFTAMQFTALQLKVRPKLSSQSTPTAFIPIEIGRPQAPIILGAAKRSSIIKRSCIRSCWRRRLLIVRASRHDSRNPACQRVSA